MATSTIRSIRILREPSFGCLDATTLEPDFDAFDGTEDVELDCVRAELTTFGDPVVNPRDEPRGAFFEVAGDPEAIPAAGGGLYRGRRGSLSLTLILEGIGASTANDFPFAWILSAGLPSIDTSILTGPEAVVDHATAQSFTVDDESDWVLGGLIGVTRAGKLLECSTIVEKAETLIGHSPAFGADLAGQTVRPMRTWASTIGALGASLAFRVDGHLWRSYAFGGRPQSYAFKATGRRVECTVVIPVAIVIDDHSTVAGLNGTNVNSVPYRTGGVVMHTMGSEVVVSNAIDLDGAAYPRVPGHTVLEVDAWEATVTNALDATGTGVSRSVLGMSEWEVVDRMVEAKITGTPTPALDGMLWDRSQRHLSLGFGPGGAAGSGGCLMLMGAFLKTDASKRLTSAPRVQQELTFGAGGWHGDDGTATAVSNSAFRIGLVL